MSSWMPGWATTPGATGAAVVAGASAGLAGWAWAAKERWPRAAAAAAGASAGLAGCA